MKFFKIAAAFGLLIGLALADACAPDGSCPSGYHCNEFKRCIAGYPKSKSVHNGPCKPDGSCFSGQHCHKLKNASIVLFSRMIEWNAQLVLTAMLITTAMNSISVFQALPERIKTAYHGLFHATLTIVALGFIVVLDARYLQIAVLLIQQVLLIMLDDTSLIVFLIKHILYITACNNSLSFIK